MSTKNPTRAAPPLTAGRVLRRKIPPGRWWSISTLHVGRDQPDHRPNPDPNINLLGGSRLGLRQRGSRVFWWRFEQEKKRAAERPASTKQDQHPAGSLLHTPSYSQAESRSCAVINRLPWGQRAAVTSITHAACAASRSAFYISSRRPSDASSPYTISPSWLLRVAAAAITRHFGFDPFPPLSYNQPVFLSILYSTHFPLYAYFSQPIPPTL